MVCDSGDVVLVSLRRIVDIGWATTYGVDAIVAALRCDYRFGQNAQVTYDHGSRMT